MNDGRHIFPSPHDACLYHRTGRATAGTAPQNIALYGPSLPLSPLVSFDLARSPQGTGSVRRTPVSLRSRVAGLSLRCPQLRGCTPMAQWSELHGEAHGKWWFAASAADLGVVVSTQQQCVPLFNPLSVACVLLRASDFRATAHRRPFWRRPRAKPADMQHMCTWKLHASAAESAICTLGRMRGARPVFDMNQTYLSAYGHGGNPVLLRGPFHLFP